MSHPLLRSSYAKLRRANKHLQDLQTEIAEYSIEEPEGLATEFEPRVPEEGDRSGVTVRVALEYQPSPMMSLIAGDVIQNIRSALDHLAYALVLGNRGRPTPRTQFPIYTDRLDRRGTVRNIQIQPRVSKTADVLVERLQPYNLKDDPTRHPLALIQELSNIDKHRSLHVVAGYAGDAEISFSSPLFSGHVVRRQGLAEDGALLAFLPLDDPVLTKGMQVHMEHSVAVGLSEFREGGGVPLGGLLDDLLSFTWDQVINRFCRRVFRVSPPSRSVFGV